MLRFHQEWEPLGGAEDEDAFMRFGLTWDQVCERVAALQQLTHDR
jgi:hypothetical protein